jgi:hypothetical protein
MTWRDRAGCTGSKNGNSPVGGTCACATTKRRTESDIMAFVNLLWVTSRIVDVQVLDSLERVV